MSGAAGSSESSDYDDSGGEESSYDESANDDTANPSSGSGSSPTRSHGEDADDSGDSSTSEPDGSPTFIKFPSARSDKKEQDDSPTFIKFPSARSDKKEPDGSPTFIKFPSARSDKKEQDDSPTFVKFPTPKLTEVPSLFSQSTNASTLHRLQRSIAREPTIVPEIVADHKRKGTMSALVGNRFEPEMLIAEGPCGKVYKAVDIKLHVPVALKRERTPNNGFSTLHMEYGVFQRLRTAPCKFPKVIWFGEEDGFNFMAMELYDMSLNDLVNRGRMKLPLKSVVGIGKHVLEQLMRVHDVGLIHRNVNPAQILINKKRKRVTLAGFRHCKPFQTPSTKSHIRRRRNRPVINDYIYASLNELRGSDQSRRDDLESLGYVLVYLLDGPLPWAKLEMSKIRPSKIATSIESLCSRCPTCFCTYLNYCRKLEFDESPDYGYLMNLFDDTAYKRPLDAPPPLPSSLKSATKRASFAPVLSGTSMPVESVTSMPMESVCFEYSAAEVRADTAAEPSIIPTTIISSKQTTVFSSSHARSVRPSGKLMSAVNIARTLDLNSTAKDEPTRVVAQKHPAKGGKVPKSKVKNPISVSPSDRIPLSDSNEISRPSSIKNGTIPKARPKPAAKKRQSKKFVRGKKGLGRPSKNYLNSAEDEEEKSNDEDPIMVQSDLVKKTETEMTVAERRVMLMDQWLDTR